MTADSNGDTRPGTAPRWFAHLTRTDVAGMTVAVVALLAGALVSHNRVPFFWYDELTTWTMVSDPSFSHMLWAIRRGTESNPPLYEIVAWGWARVAGHSELSLRLLSALCMAAAMLVIWSALRRAFATGATALGVGAVFFGSQVVLEQVSQARFYGLFALCTAVALALSVEAALRASPGRALIAATFGAHLLLVYSHVFGGFFSAAILAAIVVADLRRRQLRAPLYAAVIAAWVLFVPWIPAVLEQRALGEGRSWLARPTRDDFFALVGRQLFWLPLITVVLVASAALGQRTAAVRRAGGGATRHAATMLVLLAVFLLAVLLAVFVLSRVTVPIFLDRYLLPSAFGWAIIVAYLASTLGEEAGSGPGSPGARPPSRFDLTCALLFCAMAPYPTIFAVARPVAPRPGVEVGAEFAGLPIVVESGHQFWPLQHYSTAGRDRVRFLIDAGVAADDENAPGGAQEQKLMALYRSVGYLGTSVQDAPVFLCGHDRFLVVDRPGFTWFEQRIRESSEYRWRTVGRYLDSAVQIVERTGACAPSAPSGSPAAVREG